MTTFPTRLFASFARWEKLLAARDRKATALSTAEGVADFERTCEQTRAWMLEKFDLLNQGTDAKDLKALQVRAGGIDKNCA